MTMLVAASLLVSTLSTPLHEQVLYLPPGPKSLNCVFGKEGNRSNLFARLSTSDYHQAAVFSGQMRLDKKALFGGHIRFLSVETEGDILNLGAAWKDGSEVSLSIDLHSGSATAEIKGSSGGTTLNGYCRLR